MRMRLTRKQAYKPKSIIKAINQSRGLSVQLCLYIIGESSLSKRSNNTCREKEKVSRTKKSCALHLFCTCFVPVLYLFGYSVPNLITPKRLVRFCRVIPLNETGDSQNLILLLQLLKNDYIKFQKFTNNQNLLFYINIQATIIKWQTKLMELFCQIN